MLIRLLLLLVVVPLVELVFILTLADVVGFQATLALVIITGLAGAWLLRRQGWKAFREIGTELSAGRLPSREVLDGLLVIFAGVLLLTPGVMTDLVAMALLIPYTRSIFRGWLIRYLKSRWHVATTARRTQLRSSEIIDSYVVTPDKDGAAKPRP